jgi:hypothetical protein
LFGGFLKYFIFKVQYPINMINLKFFSPIA